MSWMLEVIVVIIVIVIPAGACEAHSYYYVLCFGYC